MKNIKIYTEERLTSKLIKEILKSLNLQDTFDEIKITSVKSEWDSSFVDCILEIYDNEILIKGFLIEITQSTEKDSRNSSSYQRLQKFIIGCYYYPNYEKVMYHTEKFNSSTDTSKVGLSLSYLSGIKIINVEGDYPKTIEDLQTFKNSMKGPSHNVPLKFWYDELNRSLLISSKLEKSGSFTHDPNIGFVSSLISVLSDKVESIIIENHGLSERHLKSKNKLYKNLSLLNKKVKFKFDNELVEWIIDKKIKIPKNYFKILTEGEKLAMVKLNNFLEKRGNEVLFRNIAGAEREKLQLNGKKITIPKKISVPDLVVRNSQGEIIIIEGECSKNVKKGLLQLKTFESFINIVRQNSQKNCEKIICGVVTDFPCEIINDNYFGYYYNSEDYQLNGFIY